MANRTVATPNERPLDPGFMNRPNWYEDEPAPGARHQIPPISMWSGTVQLIVLLVVVLILQLISPLGEILALERDRVANPLHWYRFVSYALAHSESSPWHLAFNALFIWSFGNPVESELGSKKAFYGFAALAAAFAGLAWVLVEVLSDGARNASLVGASGIAYAFVVAFAAFDPHRTVMLLVFSMKAWVLATVLMLFALFFMLSEQGDGVAHVAHLAGGLFGYLAVRYRGRVDEWVFAIEKKRVETTQRQESETRREVDRLLEKIHQTGISSLTKAERKFLETASRELKKRR